MRAGSVVVWVMAIAAACVCIRLGVWQLDRWERRRELNAAMEAMLAGAPRDVSDARALPDSLLHRVVSLRGRFDERRQVLLAGVEHQGEPGVHVLTPLVLEGDSIAVLVDRGWLSAPDGVTARPQEWPAPGERSVSGVTDTLGNGPAAPARPIEADSVELYSTDRLERAALAPRFPYSLARFYVRALPSPGEPARPIREAPPRAEPTMHLSYAVQWFAFAIAFLVAPSVLARTRRPSADRTGPGPRPGRLQKGEEP